MKNKLHFKLLKYFVACGFHKVVSATRQGFVFRIVTSSNSSSNSISRSNNSSVSHNDSSSSADE